MTQNAEKVRQARIVRYNLPGPRWYMAVCQTCRWLGMDWYDPEQAKYDRDRHNKAEHPSPIGRSGS